MKNVSRLIIIVLSIVLSFSSVDSVSAVALTSAQQERLTVIKSKGDKEITRRLSALEQLNALLTSAKRLSASDKETLTNEIATTSSGLAILQTQIENETTLDGAKTDVQNIVTEYRVYALVLPKVHFVKVADDQLTVEAALTDAATKFQSALANLKSGGKDIKTLQTTLNDMTQQVAAAQKITSTIQAKAIGLQPTDYNGDHDVLSDDNAQLKTAHADLVAARKDATTLQQGVK